MKINEKGLTLLNMVIEKALECELLSELFEFGFSTSKIGKEQCEKNELPCIKLETDYFLLIPGEKGHSFKLYELLHLSPLKDKVIKHIHYLDTKISCDETTQFTRKYKRLFYDLKIKPKHCSKNLKMVVARTLVNQTFVLKHEGVDRYLFPIVNEYDPNFISKTLPKEKLENLDLKVKQFLLPFYL